METLQQLIFGIRVFFRHLSSKNLYKIVIFLWKRYIERKPIPFSVVLAITYKCQCKCVHCFVGDYTKKEKELTTLELKEIIDYIDSWGALKITFFGGEPLTRKDLPQLVSYASQKGIRTAIDTNGLLLDEELVLNLKKAGINNINVSLDSADEQTHDRLRNSKGCFKAALNGLKLCIKHQIPCLVSTYASKRAVQENDLEKIIALAKNIKTKGVKILFPILSGNWREKEQEKLNAGEEAYLKKILNPSFVYIEDALEMVKKKGKGCSALDRNLIYISPYGDIQPCPAIPITFGNIRETKITEIINQMSSHPFFKEHHACQVCLMNETNFRDTYFSLKEKKDLPINVKNFKS